MYKCVSDDYDDLIIKNKMVFKNIHKKKSTSLLYFNHKNTIVIPVTINICLSIKNYDYNFVKYAKYIIQTLNDGFSGKIYSKYKNVYDNKYKIDYFKKILLKTFSKDKVDIYAIQIYNYINNNTDTNIKFILESIEYFNKDFTIEYENNLLDLYNKFIKDGFKIRDENKKNLNINIINFKCSILGISTYPWINYIINDIPNIMLVFIDYKTIHQDISINKYNQCKTLIHEVGHVLGLRHTFINSNNHVNIYSILLGKFIYETEILNKLNNNNYYNYKKYSNESNKIDLINKNDLTFINNKIKNINNIQLYSDIPYQSEPTNYDPIEQSNIPIINNNVINFCCFMDYSHDNVLTHFTESQSKIMYYMIRIFKPYIIKNSLQIKYNNKVKLFLPQKYKYDIIKNKIIYDVNINSTINIIEYDDYDIFTVISILNEIKN